MLTGDRCRYYCTSQSQQRYYDQGEPEFSEKFPRNFSEVSQVGISGGCLPASVSYLWQVAQAFTFPPVLVLSSTSPSLVVAPYALPPSLNFVSCTINLGNNVTISGSGSLAINEEDPIVSEILIFV